MARVIMDDVSRILISKGIVFMADVKSGNIIDMQRLLEIKSWKDIFKIVPASWGIYPKNINSGSDFYGRRGIKNFLLKTSPLKIIDMTSWGRPFNADFSYTSKHCYYDIQSFTLKSAKKASEAIRSAA
ncbi:MAG: hypothetical protein V2A72_00635 [Candidatus Omnitrophota bacterium]